MKEKWQKPKVTVLSLKNTKDGTKKRVDTYEKTIVKNSETIASTSS